MRRQGVRPTYWKKYTSATPRSENPTYNASGYPNNAQEYYFAAGLEDDPTNSAAEGKRAYEITPNEMRREGAFRSESARWRPLHEMSEMQQPFTFTIQPPGSQKAYTISPDTMGRPVHPRPYSQAHARQRRVDLSNGFRVEMPRKRAKPGSFVPYSLHPPPPPPPPPVDARRTQQEMEPVEQEPGEIVDREVTQGALRWCCLEDAIEPVDASFQGSVNAKRPWTTRSFELRTSAIPNVDIGM